MPVSALSLPGSHSVTAAFSAQDQPGKSLNVDINVNHAGGQWYANPIWIGLGVLILVVLVVIAMMAGRGGGTTVVK